MTEKNPIRNKNKVLAGRGLIVGQADGEQAVPESVEEFKILVKEAACINEANGVGETALMCATSAKDCEALRVLILKGASLNLRDKEGWTAARWAVTCLNVSALKILGRAGADLNIPDELGDSPLLVCSGERGNVKMVLALLAAGADFNLRGSDGKRAVDLAREHKHVDIEALLKAYESSATEKDKLETAAAPGRAAAKRLAL